jgi:hypothetical protein
MEGFKDFCCGPYDAYIKHVFDLCKDRSLVMKTIGEIESHNIYSIRVDNKKEHTICICAGIHGDEQAGPWALAKYLETAELKKHQYNYIILPVGNPTGFDSHKRRNHLNKDINRHFRGEKLKDENKILYNAVKDDNLCLFYSMHEHPLAKGFYIYASDSIDPALSEAIMKLSRKHGFKTRVNHGGKRMPLGELRLSTFDGDNSFEDKMTEIGVPYITIETPGTATLRKRVILQYELLKMVVENYEVQELH